MFRIGDKVRLVGHHPDSHWVVMMIYYDLNKIGVMHSTRHGTMQRVVDPLDLTLVDPKDDLKQAIREVLLSEEFLAAFAKAWMKTPILHESELNLTLEPITGSESEAYYLNKLKNGESK